MLYPRIMRALVVLVCLGLAAISHGADDMSEVLARLNAMEHKIATLEDKNKAIEERNKAIEERNKELEDRLKKNEARPAANAAIDKAMAGGEQALSTVLTEPDLFAPSRPLKISGYMDFSYEYNFNRPENHTNNNRIFDTDSNGFNVHLAQLDFSRLPVSPGEAGFQVDLAFGTDQRWFAAQDNFADPAQRSTQFKDVDLLQGYMEYIAPLGTGITFDAGKFVSWTGSEVIQAADDFNSSRSFLFGYAKPFTHTGLRATYDVFNGDENCGDGAWRVGMGIVNGWDNIQDQNNAKTGIFMSDWQPTHAFEWTVDGVVGDEQVVDERAVFTEATRGPTLINPDSFSSPVNAFSDPTIPGLLPQLTNTIWKVHHGSPRVLIDSTLTAKGPEGTRWDRLTFVLNADYAQEGDVPRFNGPGNRSWWGVAGYVKYQFLKNWYIANRLEYFADPQGVRTNRAQDLWESTLTADWALSDPLHLRLEYRHDQSNANSFSDRRPVDAAHVIHPFFADRQDTIMMQWLYKW